MLDLVVGLYPSVEAVRPLQRVRLDRDRRSAVTVPLVTHAVMVQALAHDVADRLCDQADLAEALVVRLPEQQVDILAVADEAVVAVEIIDHTEYLLALPHQLPCLSRHQIQAAVLTAA